MKRLKKAKTKNINEVSNENSIAVFQDLYDKYVGEYGFEMFDTDEYGPWGCFVYENDNNNPLIHLIEIYAFVNKNKDRDLNEQAKQVGKQFCILVEHTFDNTGHIISSTFEQCPRIFWGAVRRDLKSEAQPLKCCKQKYTFIAADDFYSAYSTAKKEIENN